MADRRTDPAGYISILLVITAAALSIHEPSIGP